MDFVLFVYRADSGWHFGEICHYEYVQRCIAQDNILLSILLRAPDVPSMYVSIHLSQSTKTVYPPPQMKFGLA